MTTIQPTRDPLVATAVEGPWGPTCIAASEQGVVAIALMADQEAFAVDLERRLGRPLDWYEPGDTSGQGREGRAFVHQHPGCEGLRPAAVCCRGHDPDGYRPAEERRHGCCQRQSTIHGQGAASFLYCQPGRPGV